MLFSLAALIVASALVSGQAGATNGEWPHWGADLGSTKYSALDQINRDNVKNLRIAWRWKSENFGPRPQNNMEGTPLMVGGVLYATAGFRPNVVAIDAATGETLWTYRFDEGARGDRAPRSVNRGVEYWTDGKAGAHHPGDARLFSSCRSTPRRACPIRHSARTASSICIRTSISRRPATASSARHRRPSSCRNVIVFGAAMVGGTAPRSKENTKGYIRGFDVRIGKAAVDVPYHSSAG